MADRMKLVILAGGLGTRISEESMYRPKPMIEIGGKPILWHIMKIYFSFGIDEFIICAGYKQEIIKSWFADYYLNFSDVTFDYKDGLSGIIIHNKNIEPWKVTVIDTGYNTQTSGRLKRIKDYLDNEPFMLTYGDGLGNVDLNRLQHFHKEHGKIGTVSLYNFQQSKGVVELGENGVISDFREKSDLDGNLINIGFMMLNPQVYNYIDNFGEDMPFEHAPMSNMVKDGQLVGYIHDGFWKCIDTKREKDEVEKLWEDGSAPWKIW